MLHDIVNNMEYVSTYAILIGHCTYTVFRKNKSDEIDPYDSHDYSFLVTAICPVELRVDGLIYQEEENAIVRKSEYDRIVAEIPTDGFLYPTFTGRGPDVNHVLYSANKPKKVNISMVEEVLGCTFTVTAQEEKATFQSMMETVVGEELNYTVITGVNEKIQEIAAEHSNDADIPVIAKIENAEGIANIDEIIRVADGIMVARGDMGVEIPAEQVPHIQKEIIRKCNAAYKPVITATQMLDSMIRNPRPTRAEVTDVANAIYDGTDVVMLSGETANGKYPLEALKMMAKIAETTEKDLLGSAVASKLHSKRSISSAVCNATVQTAENLGAKAIVCPTISGFTARLTSKLKPNAEVIGCSPYPNVLRKMQIYWGVRPLKTAPETSTDKIIEHALEVTENAGYITEGDTVIISAGIATTSAPTAKRGLTNTMRVVTL